MHKEPHTPDDIIDLTEIEKIQAEIARDLELTDSIALSVSVAAPPKEPAAQVTAPPAHRFAPRVVTPVHAEKNRMSSVSWVRRLVIVCIICTLGTATFGFAFGAAATWVVQRNQTSMNEPPSGDEPPPVTTTRYVFELPEGAVATLADMIDSVSPSVVSLTTFTNPDDFPGGITNHPRRRNGTGIIFGEDSAQIFIVTGHYIVSEGSQVQVLFSCGSSVFAQPFANDQDMDIAVIAVNKSDLAAAGITDIVLATFGDSSAMRMGDTVIALGNARGEGITVTRGIVSTEEQLLQVPLSATRFLQLQVIQTDASINYGDSGGPLLNARGEVIGIINFSLFAALIDHAALPEGIGHGISSNAVQPVLYTLINRLRPAIGILGRTITPARAEELGIPEIGVDVSRIMQNGAAENAGLLAGDVITGFNGKPVFDMDQLRAEIASLLPGDTVEVRILRDGEPMTIDVTLLPLLVDSF